MFERFTDSARHLVVQAQHEARRLGHNYIGCEHLLLAAAGLAEPAGAALRDQGITPERVEAEIVRTVGRGQAADPDGRAADPDGRTADPTGRGDPLHGLDREALASIGIDLDVVRARLEAAFGPDALDRAVLAHRRAAQASRPRRRPAWRKGPVAELMRRRRARRGAPPGPGPGRATPGQRLGPVPGGHIPFTPRAKKSLELSLREAKALHDDYIGVQHLILAQLAIGDGMPRLILSALGASAESLRADILARYRKAS